MSKKTLLLGAVASIIAINSVFADTTVTSKQYVDLVYGEFCESNDDCGTNEYCDEYNQCAPEDM